MLEAPWRQAAAELNEPPKQCNADGIKRHDALGSGSSSASGLASLENFWAANQSRDLPGGGMEQARCSCSYLRPSLLWQTEFEEKPCRQGTRKAKSEQGSMRPLQGFPRPKERLATHIEDYGLLACKTEPVYIAYVRAMPRRGTQPVAK